MFKILGIVRPSKVSVDYMHQLIWYQTHCFVYTVFCIFLAKNKIVYLNNINISVFKMVLIGVYCEVGNTFQVLCKLILYLEG